MPSAKPRRCKPRRSLDEMRIFRRVFAKRGFGVLAVPCEQRHCVRDAGGLAGFAGTEDFLLFLVELVVAWIGICGMRSCFSHGLLRSRFVALRLGMIAFKARRVQAPGTVPRLAMRCLQRAARPATIATTTPTAKATYAKVNMANLMAARDEYSKARLSGKPAGSASMT